MCLLVSKPTREIGVFFVAPNWRFSWPPTGPLRNPKSLCLNHHFSIIFHHFPIIFPPFSQHFITFPPFFMVTSPTSQDAANCGVAFAATQLPAEQLTAALQLSKYAEDGPPPVDSVRLRSDWIPMGFSGTNYSRYLSMVDICRYNYGRYNYVDITMV